MSPDPKDVIVLSDDEDNIIDAARRASDQDKKATTLLNDSSVPPIGRPRMETPEPATSGTGPTETVAQPVGRPPMDTPEKLAGKENKEAEKVSPSNGSASRLKRPHDDIEVIKEVIANVTIKELDDDIQFLRIVNENKTKTTSKHVKKKEAKKLTAKYAGKRAALKIKQEPKSPEATQEVKPHFFNEPQPSTSQQLPSMTPRHTVPSNKDRRSHRVEKMLTVNRARLTSHDNEISKTKDPVTMDSSSMFVSPAKIRSPKPSTSGLQSTSAMQKLPSPPFTSSIRISRYDLKAPVHEGRDETPERNILSIECEFDLLNISTGTPEHNVEDDWPWSDDELATPPKSPSPRTTRSSSSENDTRKTLRPVLRELERRVVQPSKEVKARALVPKAKSASPLEDVTDKDRTQDFMAYSRMIQHTRVSGWLNDEYNRDRLIAKLERFEPKTVKNLKLRYEAAWNKRIRRTATLNEKIKKLVMKDISGGQEPIPVPVYTFTSHTAKPIFKYITENEMVAPLTKEEHPYWKICCSCTDGCGENCECVKASLAAGTQIADKYLLTTSYSDFFNTFVVACGPDCHCRAKCTNSITNVMKGDNFEMFCRNEKMGYGVRANRQIEANTLLCEFVGEKITQEEHRQRVTKTNSLTSSYSYVSYYAPINDGPEDFYYKIVKTICPRANLSNYSHGNIYVDPSRRGNLGRFFGHSEYPNISMIRVITNDARLEATRLFVYSTQPIRKHDEIFLDYGQHFDLPSGCLCDHICCGDAGKHILLQSKKKAQAIFDRINEERTAEIQKHIDEEQKRQMKSPSEFHLTWRKVQLMRTRGKQFPVLKPKKKPTLKRRGRRNNGDGKQDEDKENKPSIHKQ